MIAQTRLSDSAFKLHYLRAKIVPFAKKIYNFVLSKKWLKMIELRNIEKKVRSIAGA